MLLAENKYKNLKLAGEWGNLSNAEAEIVALNANIDVLKQKGTKKPEGKTKKEDKQNENKKEKKKTDTKKADFRWQKPRPNQTKRMVEGKEYTTGALITKTRQLKNGVSGYATNRKIVKTNNRNKQIKLPKVIQTQNLQRHSNPMPTWLLSTL